jgi:hypothetical protein
MPITLSVFAFETVMLYGFPVGEAMLPSYCVTALLYIIGRLADNITTVNAFATARQAEAQGIETSLTELNFNLPKQPTAQDVFSRKKTLIDASLLIPGLLIPPIGTAMGALSLLAAANNYLVRASIATRLHNKE